MAATGRGDWLQTYGGQAFYPMDPRPEEVDPLDIAHALSLLCRYAGHCRTFYSVAEHCVLISYAVDPQHALWGLLHDATETYLVDLPRPVKRAFPEYVAAEDRLMRVICDRFGLPHTVPDQVKEADNRILHDERAALMRPPPMPWNSLEADCRPLGVPIQGWDPATAEQRYLQRLLQLIR